MRKKISAIAANCNLKTAFIFALALLLQNVAAQETCMLFPVSLEQRIINSEIIAEGKVLSQQSFWENRVIYTLNKVEVYKIFKGDNHKRVIHVLTEGGTVDAISLVATSTLELSAGAEGVFFLYPVSIGKNKTNGEPAYMVYSSLQGFIRYDDLSNTASEPFHKYNSIVKDVYPAIKSITGKTPFVVAKRKTAVHGNIAMKGMAQPVISSFSPSVVSAGTGTVLQINGSGFGATQGNGFVEFARANDLGATFGRALSTDILSWSDTQIQLKVPSVILNSTGVNIGSAGTGLIRVTNNDPLTATSATPVTIEFSAFNVLNSNTAFPFDHIDDNGSGGYTFQKNIDFAANSAASAAFDRAFNNWICNTHINWIQGGTTSANTKSADGVNAVMFDDNDPLPAGVAGRGDNFIALCTAGSTPVRRIIECDIRFDNAAAGLSWNFSTANPTGSQVDFETVSLHELGHLVALDHVINPTAVMHPQISAGTQKRVLQTPDLNGADFILGLSFATNACGEPGMIPFTLPAQPTVTISANTNPSCTGSSVTFTATTANAAGAAFQWKKNGTNAGTNSSSFSTSSLVNNDVITCTITVSSNQCFNSATSNPITVNRITTPAPSSISGPSCETNLTAVGYTAAAVTGATSYTWTFPAGVTFNGANNTQTVSVTFPSTFVSGTITARATANGCTGNNSPAFSVRSQPAQPGAITGQSGGLCSTSPIANVSYSISSVPNTTGYAWSATTGITINTPANGTSITANYPASFSSGTITVIAQNGSCNSVARTLNVTGAPSMPGPISGPSNLGPAPTGAAYSISSVPTATSYSWSATGGHVSFGQGFTNVNIIFTGNGTKTVRVSAINSCGVSAQRTKSVQVGPFPRMAMNENDDVTVYPNPTADFITVSTPHSGNESELILLDATGKEILRTIKPADSCCSDIDISSLPNGIYILQLTSGEKRLYKKIIKKL